MEFYLNNIASAASPKKVSIPNGMEFYQFQGFIMYDFIDCFNSQRDGILPKPKNF